MRFRKRITVWLVGLAGAAGAVAIPAKAGTLSAAVTFVQCSADGNSSFDSTTCTTGGIPGVPSSAFGSATLSPFAAAIAEAISPSNGVFGAGVTAEASYSFQVTGGNPGDIVPILIAATLHASRTGNGSATARLLLTTSAGGFAAYGDCTDQPTCGALGLNPFPGILSAQALSGSTNDLLTLAATAHADPNGTANAFADPFIYVDPTFANASLYSIVVSPGVGNQAATSAPEPGVAFLVGTALGALCLRRNRRAR